MADGEHSDGDEGRRRGATAASHRPRPPPAAPPRTRRHPRLVPRCPRARCSLAEGRLRTGRDQCTSHKVPIPVLSGVGNVLSPSARLGAGREGGRVWVSPLSFECHTQSEVGPWLRLEGFLGGCCSLGCSSPGCPGGWHRPRVGMQREQPEAL